MPLGLGRAIYFEIPIGFKASNPFNFSMDSFAVCFRTLSLISRTFFNMQMKISRKHSLAKRSGFTLIEIMLAIGLMALLATVVIINVDRIFGSQQEGIAKFKVSEAFKTPLTTYRVHMGRYPTTEEGLQALLKKPASDTRGRWKGPYVEDTSDLEDPWGQPLQYRFPGVKNPSKYDLYSFGPDMVQSDDDIGNWE